MYNCKFYNFNTKHIHLILTYGKRKLQGGGRGGRKKLDGFRNTVQVENMNYKYFVGMKQIQNIKYNKYQFLITVNPCDQFQVTLARVNMADQTLDKKVEEQEQGGREEQEEQDRASGGHEEESPLAKLIISELECPICLESMVGRVRRPLLCRKGHACCSTCRRQLGSRCPTCRSPASWGRCLTLEKLGEHLVETGQLQEPSLYGYGIWEVVMAWLEEIVEQEDDVE